MASEVGANMGTKLLTCGVCPISGYLVSELHSVISLPVGIGESVGVEKISHILHN